MTWYILFFQPYACSSMCAADDGVIDYCHVFADSNIIVYRIHSHKTPHQVLLHPCLLKILNLNFIDLINRHNKRSHPIIQVL